MSGIEPKELFETLFHESVRAADPALAMQAFMPEPPRGRLVVVGAGKSTGKMAEAFEKAWDGPLEGVVVVPHGHEVSVEKIRVLHAAHPVPDEAGLAATRTLFDAVDGLSADDLVVALISGGGSALLPAPPEGMTLDDEIAVNRALLASGAPISAMNVVRKHLSTIKGGQLALAAHPATVLTLIVSDIPGDDPAMVASGPTVPDRANRAEAQQIVESYGIELPSAALTRLASPQADLTPPEDERFEGNEVKIIASAAKALEAVAEKARELGIPAAILSEAIEGEARDIGAMHGAIAREVALKSRPFAKPVLLISGGETTVTIRGGGGKGGRNSEFLLALALSIEGFAGIHAFAADTDGRDGSEHNAGAFADGSSVMRMRQNGRDPRQSLANHDSWSAFSCVGDIFHCGPTGTNVNDLRLVLIR